MGFFDKLTDTFRKSTFPKEAPFSQEYEPVKDLVPGAMSTICLVRHKQSKRPFVIKKVRPQTEQAKKKLERELEVSFLMTHPNIVRTIAWERKGAETWILMEFIDGASLRAWTRDQFVTHGAKPPLVSGRDFMTLFCHAALALQYVHGKGWVHMDVKPENFLVSGLRSIAESSASRAKDTQVFKREVLEQAGGISLKLIDFGVSVRLDEPKGNLGGSPLYVAPEVVAGPKMQAQVGIAADLWSLGATMYELACGRPPYLPQWFEGKPKHWQAHWGEYESQDQAVKRSYDAEMLQRRFSTPVDMSCVPYSDAIKAILKRCLELPPQKRYTSAAQLVAELERFL